MTSALVVIAVPQVIIGWQWPRKASGIKIGVRLHYCFVDFCSFSHVCCSVCYTESYLADQSLRGARQQQQGQAARIPQPDNRAEEDEEEAATEPPVSQAGTIGQLGQMLGSLVSGRQMNEQQEEDEEDDAVSSSADEPGDTEPEYNTPMRQSGNPAIDGGVQAITDRINSQMKLNSSFFRDRSQKLPLVMWT